MAKRQDEQIAATGSLFSSLREICQHQHHIATHDSGIYQSCSMVSN
jgi:hypothetical protein